ncbi:hypothetical protein FJV46_12660 [Arthrobacter agilis]|uniref:hypothetical protein n=1 Tax=Arthrobacter agilis TaxID=37921 RepID=UPI000B35F4F9|nr:hypothetical protein [Arthrobacter agilis]OUM44557.1 hypothetical protein B8W74_03610 [Arthrobacter agilis]PPB47591.1 hypothetical protein CI784_01270 [Arthrobacter agilis]TPV22748.1 hypothetical protein FJV46_12660 [Arthrobacter agilis]VDR31992.1 Uncharacterised protein [Arthrobacter agilis]
MAISPIESSVRTPGSADSACVALAECSRQASRDDLLMSEPEALQFVLDVERASKIVDQLQIRAARLAEDLVASAQQESGPGETAVRGASTSLGFRDCADFLRATLGISRAEARRRLDLAEVLLPTVSPTGAPVPPRLETLGAAAGA